jgi:hypothetical protein
MSEPVNYDDLERMYREATASVDPNPIVRYEIDEQGVVHLYAENGSWRGMCSQGALSKILELSKPKEG